MGTVWIKELTGGLDVRRLPETTPGGVLIRGADGHITRGGEFEKRAAFVPVYSLPAGTIGLAHTRTGLLVFGHDVAPPMPTGVSYQRLQHPTDQTLVRVLSYDLYDGKAYVVGEYSDGSVFHFYDGVRVEDWFDGRARAAITIAGGINAAIAATGSFTITGGTSGVGNQITTVTVDGVSVTSGPVAHTGDNGTTAAAVATAINSSVSTPDYTATSDGATVTITAAAPGPAANGRAVVVTPGGNATTASVVNMAGGAVATTAELTDLKVGGVSIIASPVVWSDSDADTAAAIAAAITGFASSPEYTATSVGAKVNIVASATGVAENGKAVTFTTANGMSVEPSGAVLTGGVDDDEAFTPGSFVKTVGSKIYSVSGSNLHFSGIQAPTSWTTDAVGAGFINMASENSGSEGLTAVARYQSLLAVFAPSVVQIWYIDPDPDLNRQSQVLGNTGTESPLSVTQFGDDDIFYLDESGLRSLRARDSSNAASTTDIGVPVDELITAKLADLSAVERQGIVGLINPIDKRFWLIIRDEVFVFSYYANAKVSAWTTYTLTRKTASDGALEAFTADGAVVFGRRTYIRGGDTIYAYGGSAGALTYDAVEAEAWLPYLDANQPTAKKDWNGIDAAVIGLWEVEAGMDPTNLETVDPVARITRTTFDEQRISFEHSSTHVSLRFKSKGSGRAVLSAAVIHYRGAENED